MSAAAKLNPQLNIKLVVQKGPHSGQRFAFSKAKVTIGRSPENDIILVNDPLISRQHAYIQINNNDVEIVNLSSKNPIFVNNENVNKWKLTSDTVFMIGDTEFLIQIENQQSVVVVKPQASAPAPAPKAAALKVVPKKPSQPLAKKLGAYQGFAPPQGAPQMQQAPQFQMAPTPSAQSVPNGKMIFYIIIAALIVGGLYFYLNDDAASKTKKIKKPSTLKYSDETAFKLNPQEASSRFEKQEKAAKFKQSIAYLRAEENFTKGTRAFQLGNYSSAIELFQLTLTTNSEHVLAKRYLYLAKVRFDEIVKAKLDLGQSYFERNNFKLCKSLFQQVIDMLSAKEQLQGPSKDTNLLLAREMLRKCEFAAEGIH
jgi:pSer/pThr/pTyr-binding forkhead associated (FHA) protein